MRQKQALVIAAESLKELTAVVARAVIFVAPLMVFPFALLVM